MDEGKFDYSKEYNEFWLRPERWGESSFEDINILKEEILNSCGVGKYLDVGCGMGWLVSQFCKDGIDAYGVDVADIAIGELNSKMPGRFKVGSILDLPYADNSFDTLITTDCLEHIQTEDIPSALKELCRVTKKNIYVRLSTRQDWDSRWHLTVKDYAWWENQFFAAGFRKHPAYYYINQYESLEDTGDQLIAIYEKIAPEVFVTHNLNELQKVRDLHTDMTRETGCRSDGHIIRYFLATEFIQSGDSVLDCACGLGYGSYLMSRLVGIRKVQGIDISDEAVDYANANFKLDNTISFAKDDAQQLVSVADNSIDFVTSFETLEHIPEPEKFLQEAYRVLKPGGRIIVSVPNCWLDENGVDPSQYHLHTYTWEKLYQQIKKHFYPEKAWELTMNGFYQDGIRYSAPRRLREFSLDVQPSYEAECILLLAMKDPLSEGYTDYEETAWDNYDEEHNFVSFKRDYINPYIWKIVLSSPHRDVKTNVGFCERIIATYPRDSADYGGALCYLSYRLLEKDQFKSDEVIEQIKIIDEYLVIKSENKHVYRWKISLTFVKAQLLFKIGNFYRAGKILLECTAYNPNLFSPTIATKLMQAYVKLGQLEQAYNKNGTLYWEKALELIKDMFINMEWTNVFGNTNKPIPFGLKEMADIFNSGANCAWDILFADKPYANYNKKRNTTHENIIRELETKIVEIVDAKEKLRADLEQQIVDIVQDKERVWQLVADLKKQNDYLQSTLDGVLNSKSWKITKFLRYIKTKIKK